MSDRTGLDLRQGLETLLWEVAAIDRAFFAGFDIGSAAVHCVVVNDCNSVVFSPPPNLHQGRPLDSLRRSLREILDLFPGGSLVSTAFTGIGSLHFPEAFPGVLREFDSVCVVRGARFVEPECEAILHLGARDACFFHVTGDRFNPVILDWSTSSKCGAGSGTLLEKQVRRLFPSCGESPGSLEGTLEMAASEASRHPEAPPYNARCGVVLQSDLIHDQNEGLPRELIMARLFRTIASNIVQDVIGNRDIRQGTRSVLTGWPAGCAPLFDNIKNLTSLDLLRPDHFANVGAIGAALLALERNNRFVIEGDRIDEAARIARSKRQYLPPLRASLERVHIHGFAPSAVCDREGASGGPEVVIGIDGGSTTTKAVALSLADRRILGSRYIPTHGDPLGALADVMGHLSKTLGGLPVAGVCTTGSARQLYERVLSSPSLRRTLEDRGCSVPDGAVDEITCHAVGIRSMDDRIDTIFEIGGQDMKFTTFRREEDRVTDQVDEARMNYSCQAGAGQTLENMSTILRLDVRDSLQELALEADRVPVIDATCGVFMELEEQRLIAENHSAREIAAAITRATASSYFNKFVGGTSHVGERCSCQGGPSLGKAFLAAMADVTGRDIHAYPGRELMGALGAALFIRERILSARRDGQETASAFRGWGAASDSFSHQDTTCPEHFGARSCGKRECKLRIYSIAGEEVVTGGFCPLGNSEGSGSARPDHVGIFHSILEKHFQGEQFDALDREESDRRPRIGIRRCTTTIGGRAIWSSALFSSLGFLPVLSPVSDERISRLGLRNSPTDFCVAMKLSAGHTALLAADPGIDHIFIPSLIRRTRETGPSHMFCIYTEAEGFLPEDDLGLPDGKIIRPVWHLGNRKQMARSLEREFFRVGYHFTMQEIQDAFRKADASEEAFNKDIARLGDAFLETLSRNGERGYVGIGRDYVVLDPAASSSTGRMFATVRGMPYIPQVFLRHLFSRIPIDDLVENEYWEHSAEILKASIFTARHERLFPVRQMNFACGPDSIKFLMEDAIFRRAGKPFLHLLTDAQTNNAPFVTRAEAFERVASRWQPKETPLERFSFVRRSTDGVEGRRWLIPWMGNASTLGAAAAKYWGIDAVVAPTDTPESRETAERLISTETCFPLKGVIGDLISFLEREAREKGAERVCSEYLVFMPTTSGPCRFGKYAEVLALSLESLGFGRIPIVSPTTENGYLDPKTLGITWPLMTRAGFSRDIYNSIRAADLFDDLVLRFRPYSADRGSFNKTARGRLGLLEETFRRKGSSLRDIVEWGRGTAEVFSSLCPENHERSPLVLYLGEIYMRQHDPYTGHVAELLEREGLELVRGPVTEWLRYVIHIASKKSPGLEFKAAALYMNFAEKVIERGMNDILGDRKVLPHPEDTLPEVEREGIYHSDITGESSISIGLFNAFLSGRLREDPENPVCGVFHVGPFTCMQEGVATARIRGMLKARRRYDPGLVAPVMHASFGESPNPNLEAEVAAFREQCLIMRRSLKGSLAKAL